MYLMIGSRPDIGFAVVKLAQQMANPFNDHYQVGLHLCRYLLATRRYWLVYNGLGNESLVVYSDSDWGQDHEHRKSTTSYASSRNHFLVKSQTKISSPLLY